MVIKTGIKSIVGFFFKTFKSYGAGKKAKSEHITVKTNLRIKMPRNKEERG